jgi:hypothetical protein
MHVSGWVELVRTIPAEFHNALAVLMQNGTEINLQSIVRLEEQFVVCRGRTAGSTDASLMFFLPYDQITCIYYVRPAKEDLVNGWFGRAPFYSIEREEAPAPPVEPPVAAEPEPAAPGPAAPAAPAPLPGSAPGVAPAPAAAAKPAPVVPGRPAPAPQPAATPMTMANMVLPAKAAMIERLRKRQPPGGAAPAPPAKPPEQK